MQVFPIQTPKSLQNQNLTDYHRIQLTFPTSCNQSNKFNFNLVSKLRPTISTCRFFCTLLPLNKLCFNHFVNTNYSFTKMFFLSYHKIHKLGITQDQCKNVSPPLAHNCSSCVPSTIEIEYLGSFSAIFPPEIPSLEKSFPLNSQ